MRCEGTGLSDPTISQWGYDSGLDSLGLDGPRNLHPQQMFRELLQGGWDTLDSPVDSLPQCHLLTLGLLAFICWRQRMRGGDALLDQTGCRVGLFSFPLYQMQQ